MKVFLSILSISLLSTIWLGPGVAGGAQLLSDDDLDQVTAGGVDYSIDFFPGSNLIFGTTPTTGLVQPLNDLAPSLSAVQAASAAALTAQALPGVSGLFVATDAVHTAASALESAFQHNSTDTLIAGRETLFAAGQILNQVPLEQHTPEISAAVAKVNEASANLNQTALQYKASDLIQAKAAIESVKNALRGWSDVGGDIDPTAGIEAAVKSIQTAKDAINAAFQARAASAGGSQSTFVLKENGDGSLQPVVRINFNSRSIRGQADIIPLTTRGGPSQPGLDALNLDGAAFANGNGTLPITLVAETLMMNFNFCMYCIADKIIQTNNGYVVPIYAQ